jgi:hypothetical protein
MKHYYQINSVGCVQAATAMLLSALNVNKTPAEVEKEVPMRSWPGKDELAGTPNQDVAAYMCRLGLDVEIISFDIWVTDLGWAGKDTAYIESRLKEASDKMTAPMIGRAGTELYIQAYLDYIKAGGKLSVQPFPSSKLITGLLQTGPIMTSVAYDTLYGQGKHVNNKELFDSTADDINGLAPNHNIVISRAVDNKIEVYDPWNKPGIHLVEPEQLITAIATAQQECDNMLVVVRKNN